MDYLGEALALGVDTLLFGICCKYYLRQRHAVKAVENAPIIDVSSNLDDIISANPEKTIPYAAIRGVVKPLGSPITSINHSDVTGTIQKLSVKEHVFTRNSAGFWGEQHRPIQEVYNIVPFVLQSGKNKVEVTDVLDADILDLETIADHFEPSTSSALEHLWGFFTGIRRHGIQNKEEMLRVGALVTGIGEIKASKEGLVKLAAPSDGTPYYLTVLPISSLIRRLEEQKRLYRFYMLIFGGVAVFIAGLITHRWWKEQMRKRKEEEMHRRVEAMRRQRRAQLRDNELPESQLCVVCRQNPREVILLPCGHVCLCEDCSDGITDFCPICRTKIDNKAAAYIA